MKRGLGATEGTQVGGTVERAPLFAVSGQGNSIQSTASQSLSEYNKAEPCEGAELVTGTAGKLAGR